MSSKKYLCTEQDAFLEDKAIWVATLSNGMTCYQDDHRPGLDEPIAWKRLRSCCQQENISIDFLRIKFRSNVVPITPKKNSPHHYYFSYGITKEVVSEFHQEYYVCGFCLDNSLHYSWYKIPELIKQKSNTVDIPENAAEDERFIRNGQLTNPLYKL
jgi:hypothetical protein